MLSIREPFLRLKFKTVGSNSVLSAEGEVFRLKARFAEYITNMKDQLLENGSMKFDYINSNQMKRIIEYLEFRDLYSRSKEPPNFRIRESEALELLVIADRLGI
ncbi:Skp1 family protein [Cryptosporidium felis]|nr:Skp1 family protein [Cryptosporidium felis]